MGQLVQELHLTQHIGPIRAQLVHLQHHHLARSPVGHLGGGAEQVQVNY